MKIAVPFFNGEISQHFGKSESFKIYETKSVFIINSEVVSAESTGHDALASFLKEQEVQVVICGHMGEGAKLALACMGIEVLAGASGDADAAVKACLNGELNLNEQQHTCGCSCGCHGGSCHH